MQRPTSSSRASDEHVIDINPEQPQPKPRRKTDSVSISSLFDYCRLVFRKISRSRASKNWIQSVTAIAVLCFLILWWFSYPGAGNLVVKDGRMTGGRRLELPKSLDDHRIDIAALAVATSTTPPVAQNLALKDEEADSPMVSSSD